MMQGWKSRARWDTGLLLCVLCASVVNFGCRGDRDDKPPHQFFPDMDDSPKWRPQTRSEFFADGRSMRPPVRGTVPFARWGFTTRDFLLQDNPAFEPVLERADLIQADEAFYHGITGWTPDQKPMYVKRVPIAVDAALLKRGQERFNIYCAVCHGYQGRGEGMVGQRWTGLTVANFHDPKYSNPQEPDHKGDDGFFFFTAMNGVPGLPGPEGTVLPTDDEAARAAKLKAMKMPPYNHALTARDAWAITAYIRALQASQGGRMEDVPAEQRDRLAEEKAKMPPPAPTGASGPTGTTGATGSTGATGATGGKP